MIGGPRSTFRNHAGWFLVTLAVFVLGIICIACGGGSSMGAVQNPPAAPDALGSVVAVTQLPCSQLLGADGGATSGTCYQATVSCPGVNDEDVGVKVNAPAGSSLGTVSLQVGGGGTPWYDQHFVYGTKLVNDLNASGFTAVQFNWGFLPTGFPQGGTFAGWLTGPGGPRKLACRFATIEKWVHDNTSIHASNSAFCHSGNSAGSGVGAYALAHYGLGSILNYVEETSGPPFAQIDQGCICNSPPVQTPCNPQPLNTCYGTDGNDYIDPAYDPTTHICSSVEANHSTANKSMFINDSLLSSDATSLIRTPLCTSCSADRTPARPYPRPCSGKMP